MVGLRPVQQYYRMRDHNQKLKEFVAAQQQMVFLQQTCQQSYRGKDKMNLEGICSCSIDCSFTQDLAAVLVYVIEVLVCFA